MTIHHGSALDVLRGMESESVDCCITSPPYFGLRDYGEAGQIGLEATPDEFIGKLVEVFREVRRVLKKDGTAWVNMGDSYASPPGSRGSQGANGEVAGRAACIERQAVATSRSARTTQGKHSYMATLPEGGGRFALPGLKAKDLIGIPWMLAFALRADGWYLRQDIIWHKPNPMPESVRDRCTKAHEYIFLLSPHAGRPRYETHNYARRESDQRGHCEMAAKPRV